MFRLRFILTQRDSRVVHADDVRRNGKIRNCYKLRQIIFIKIYTHEFHLDKEILYCIKKLLILSSV